MLHEAHNGVVRMKCVARESVWWPKIDDQIYDWVAACRPCQENCDATPQVKGATWPTPKDLWTRVHADFAGPVDENKKLLVMANATTKWPEVHVMTFTAAPATIQAIESSFCRLNYPENLVTDNGPPFSSKEFGSYAKKSGIDHRMGAPYHPSSNGLTMVFYDHDHGLLLGCAREAAPEMVPVILSVFGCIFPAVFIKLFYVGSVNLTGALSVCF